MASSERLDEKTSGWRRAAPALVLVVVAPVVAEVLLGATRLSVIFVLIPQIAIWGCGTLLIRDAVRRLRRGWLSLLLLGIALAVAEECLIQQTSLAPLVGLARQEYGRVWGVNWVYFLWALGYESVWVVVLPVQLTELIFPARRRQAWVGTRGLVGASVAFALGSFVAWFSWTQHARTEVFHMPEYQPPLVYVVLALLAILALIIAALGPWMAPKVRREIARSAPRPWLVGVVAFVFGFPWSMLVLLGYGMVPAVPAGLTLVVGVAWACAAFLVMRQWASRLDWDDRNRHAVVFGGILACMAGGFVIFAAGGAHAVDWIGKVAINGVATWLLIRLGQRLQHCDRIRASSAG